MTIICRYCKKGNVSSASYCVNCGKVLNDANIKMVVPKKEFESLMNQKRVLEDTVRKFENLDESRVEQIQKLQKEINDISNDKQDSFYAVVLKSAGAAKLQVVKAVKESLGLGLKEAKDIVDSTIETPVLLKEKISKGAAEKIKSEIEAAGAIVELRSSDIHLQAGDTIYYDVFLINAGAAKLQVVKAVKESLGLGLKEAKDYVDEAPSILSKGISRSEAENLKKEIEAAGGTIEMRQHIDASLGYVLVKKLDYDNLITERRKIFENGYAPLGYHIEKDAQEPNLWMKKVKDVVNRNTSEVTIKKSEYDNLKKRANMSLWEKIKESWGG
jgi:large subunit ribosomal protein L7/L12